MEGIPNLPPHLQGEFMRNLENIQMKDSLRWVVSYCVFVAEAESEIPPNLESASLTSKLHVTSLVPS